MHQQPIQEGIRLSLPVTGSGPSGTPAAERLYPGRDLTLRVRYLPVGGRDDSLSRDLQSCRSGPEGSLADRRDDWGVPDASGMRSRSRALRLPRERGTGPVPSAPSGSVGSRSIRGWCPPTTSSGREGARGANGDTGIRGQANPKRRPVRAPAIRTDEEESVVAQTGTRHCSREKRAPAPVRPSPRGHFHGLIVRHAHPGHQTSPSTDGVAGDDGEIVPACGQTARSGAGSASRGVQKRQTERR